MVEQMGFVGYDIIPVKKNVQQISILKYDTIIIATSTLGEGEIPKAFKPLIPQFLELQDKNIGLFGSGNSIYPNFCGALDSFEDFLKRRNKVLFKFKFEEFPTDNDVQLLKNVLHEQNLLI